MHKIIRISFIFLLLFILISCGKTEDTDDMNNGQPVENDHIVEPSVPSDHDEPLDQELLQIKERVKQMSLKDKLGQLIIAGFSGTTVNEELMSLIQDHKVGGIIFYSANLPDPSSALNLINAIKKRNEDNAFPLFLGVDQEGGQVSRLPEFAQLPTNDQIGLQNDVELSYAIGKILAQQLRAYGLNMNFAPVLDVNSNPNNPVIGNRSFSSDPNIVSELGIATMKGMQEQRVIPVVKHFPGHGDTTVDSHLELPIVYKTLEQLKIVELLPFQKAIEEGVDVIMVAHILLPEIDEDTPSSMSKYLISDLLRKKLGYNGLVITDDLTMKAITNQYDIATAAVSSVMAGSDMVMIAHDYNSVVHTISVFEDAIQAGVLTEERINESVERILLLKQKYSISNDTVEQLELESINQSIEEIVKKIQ